MVNDYISGVEVVVARDGGCGWDGCFSHWRQLVSSRWGRLVAVAHAPPAMVLFFLFLFLPLNLCLRADGHCRAVQARLCRKRCRHVIGPGPYLLSMTSSPFALVAVPGFSSFHFRFAPLISAPFAICRWLPSAQLLCCHWLITVA